MNNDEYKQLTRITVALEKLVDLINSPENPIYVQLAAIADRLHNLEDALDDHGKGIQHGLSSITGSIDANNL